MTAVPRIDPARLLDEQVAQASPDLLRKLLTTFINTLLAAEALRSVVPATGSPARTGSIREGYRHRDLDTRVGSLGLPPRRGVPQAAHRRLLSGLAA